MFGPVAVRPSRAPARCTTSTPRASRPSRRRPGMPAVGDAPAAAWSWVREDVARAPADLGAERDQRLDQHGGLDRHVQRAGDARALERLRVGVLARGSPSGRASRARRAGSPCGRTRRARGRRPCSRVVRFGGGHAFSSGGGGQGGGVEQALVLLLLPAQPVGGGHVVGTLGLGLEPGSVASRSSGSRRRREAKARSDRPRSCSSAARAACAGAAARPGRRGGSRTPTGRARPARRARRSAASAATTRGLRRLVDRQCVHRRPGVAQP